MTHALDELASSLKPDDSSDLRTLSKGIVDASLFSPARGSLRERLTTSEQDFRNGSRSGIAVQTLTASINTIGSSMGLPQFSPMGVEQVQSIRTRLLTRFPYLFRAIPRAGQPASDLCPLGAFFLADLALRQKIQNPEFQTTAEEWLQKNASASITPSGHQSPTLVVSPAETGGGARAATEHFQADPTWAETARPPHSQ